jgi:hypothetical protein
MQSRFVVDHRCRKFAEGARARLSGLCIAGWQPVAIAPGSVFVDP